MPSFAERVVDLFFPGFVETKVQSALSETTIGSGATIDADENEFRRLTGTSRSLSTIEMDRAQAIALHLWRRNPMAHRLTEMLADFVVGDGITFEAEDPDVMEVMDEFWHDPKMQLHLRHRDLVRDQSIYGEQAWEAVVNETSGRVRLRYIDPDRIKDVKVNSENALEDAAVILKPKDVGSPPIVLPTVTFDDETDPTAPKWEGKSFYFGVNRVAGQSRGVPDLLAIADFADGYDQLLFNSIERSALINGFVWDVTLTGSTDTQVNEWAQKHGEAPPPGSVRAHNDKETWAAVAPNLGNADMMALGRPVKNMALGGFGAPEAWFAEGDSANRATLAAQGDPTYRLITSRQTVVGAAWTHVFGFVIAMAIDAGRLPVNVNREFRVILPEPSSADMAALGTTITALTTALAAAEEAGWLSKDTARSIFAAVVSGFGVEVDPKDEEAKVEDEADEAEQEAIDAGLPTPNEQKAMAAQNLAGMNGTPPPGQEQEVAV